MEENNKLAFDLADRMRKALRASDTSVQDMADFLGVTRGTVSTWINGHIHPSTQTLRLWAARTNVPYEWLTGHAEEADTGSILLAWAS
jgi:transcriptional regulator with XRE-family HTH domain